MADVGKPVVFVEKPFYDRLKRVLDIVCAIGALAVLAVPLLLIMLIIFIDDPGPVIFRQVRIGRNGERFVIYKFRSMVTNAEALKADLLAHNQVSGVNFKMYEDPRCTRFGRILRRCSLDELPQLVNILKGDMSVIGPRPFVPDEQALLPDDRLLVRPGLSGYWQVMGKNAMSLEEQMELDRRYIRERSLWTDIKIVVMTFSTVVRRANS